MERAKVFIVEDDPSWLQDNQEAVEEDGHEVIGKSTTADGAISYASKVKDGLCPAPDVVVSDGNLSSSSTDCRDGYSVAQVFRYVAPNVRVIAFTAASESFARYGDHYIDKTDGDSLTQLKRLISSF